MKNFTKSIACGVVLSVAPSDEEAFQTCGYYRKEVLHLEPPRNPCLDCSTDIYYCNRKQCSSYRAYVLDCIDGGYGLPH